MAKISKLFLSVFFSSMSLSLFSQEYFVSTQATKKRVLLEEFTGVGCTYCPDGHKKSDAFKKLYKDKYFSINIHQGGFAGGPPNYKTSFGDSIAKEAGVSGYPMGSINRTVFAGTQTALGREGWADFVPVVLRETACVNLAAKSFLDWNTRQLVCIVQGYYTSNSAQTTNYLNVAILQNNVIGTQAGAGYYVEMVVDGGKYRHNHMLRHFITDQWGIPISNTKSGAYFSDTLRYTLPMDYYGIPFEMGEMDIIAYVSETHQNVLNVCDSWIDYKNMPSNPRLVSAKQAAVQNCNGLAAVEVTIKNIGEGRINTIDFEYTYNNETFQCTWGNNIKYISPNVTDTVVLSTFPLVEGVSEVNLRILKINGEVLSDTIPTDSIVGIAQITKRVGKSSKAQSVKFELNLDQYASEVSWRLTNSQGTIIAQKEYTEDLPAEGTKTYTEIVPITEGDCYLFEILDKGKDGINSNFGKGSYKIYDDQNMLLAESDGKYKELDYQILSLGTVSNEESMVLPKNSMSIYPNPSQGQGKCSLYLEKSERIQLSLFDLSGRKIQSVSDKIYTSGTHEIDFDFSNLAPAMYILYMQSSQGTQTHKLNIIK